MFVFGRLSAAERDRRTLLRAVTSLGAPPEVMPESVRTNVLKQLALEWSRVGGADWKEHLRSGQANLGEVKLLYALAEFESDPDLVAIARHQMGA